jgi:hypothetical protein
MIKSEVPEPRNTLYLQGKTIIFTKSAERENYEKIMKHRP